MKPALIVMVGALAGALACSEAMAADGNQLLGFCKNAISDNEELSGSSNAGFCIGTMQTVGDLTSYINDSLKPGVKFCSPPGMTNGQAARVVVKYLQDNPEELHLKATDLTIRAMQNAYPCN